MPSDTSRLRPFAALVCVFALLGCAQRRDRAAEVEEIAAVIADGQNIRDEEFRTSIYFRPDWRDRAIARMILRRLDR